MPLSARINCLPSTMRRSIFLAITCVAASLAFFLWHVPCPRAVVPCNPPDQGRSTTLTIHFVWIRPFLRDAPDPKVHEVWQLARTWANLTTPRAQLMVWTRAEIAAHFPDLVPLFERISTPAWISDIARYHIINTYGGLYLDTDVLPLRDPTHLWRQLNGAFAVCENPYTDPRDAILSHLHADAPCNSMINAIIAAPKNHPASFCAKHQSVERTEDMLHRGITRYNLVVTGPALWTECIRQHPCTIRIIPSWTFLPCPCCEDGCRLEDYRNTLAFGMHYWSKSWVIKGFST